ncbi:MAG: hypothetical protein V1798_04755 [Pseudomonadota bacterium]
MAGGTLVVATVLFFLVYQALSSKPKKYAESQKTSAYPWWLKGAATLLVGVALMALAPALRASIGQDFAVVLVAIGGVLILGAFLFLYYYRWWRAVRHPMTCLKCGMRIPVNESLKPTIDHCPQCGCATSPGAGEPGNGKSKRFNRNAVWIVLAVVTYAVLELQPWTFYRNQKPEGVRNPDDPGKNSQNVAQSIPYDTAYPLSGFWKLDCGRNFGIAIQRAGNNQYSVSFCGPGGCFKPGTWMPNTTIVNDPEFQVINNDTLKLKGSKGFDEWHRCESPPNPK